MKRAFAFLLLLLAAPAQADFAAACAQTGVWYCKDFSDGYGSAQITAGTAPNGSTPTVENGMLRFTIPSQSKANAGGNLRIIDANGHWVPGKIGIGETLSWAFRIKSDTTALSQSGWPAKKMHILWEGSSSCTELEITSTHGRIPTGFTGAAAAAYTSCGATGRNFNYEIPTNNFQLHYPDYNCTYSGKDTVGSAGSDCARNYPDVWSDFYFELTVGDSGTATTQIVQWHRYGSNGTWRRWIDTNTHPDGGYVFTLGPTDGFNGFMLTVYMTDKDESEVHPVGRVDYDYLILSTSPMNKTLLAAIPASGILPSVSRPQTRVCFSGMCINVVDDR